jgi:hypothetical protein
MPDGSPASIPRSLQRALCVAALGALCILAAVKVLWIATIIEKPGEMTYPAGANAYIARRVQQGGVLYGDWRRRPHMLTIYGPLLYLPAAWIGRWVNADAQGICMIGRWISLAATLATAGLIVSMVGHRPAGHLFFGVLMGLVFFTCDEVITSADMCFRPDAPACLLMLLGLSLVVSFQRPATLYASLVFFLLAFLYKQSSVAGPPAVALWLWLSGQRGRAIRYGFLAVVAFLGTFVLLEVLTGGAYSLNTVKALKGNTGLRNIPTILNTVAVPAVLPLTAALYVLGVEMTARKWQPLTIAFAFSLVLSVASTYRDGSGENYYIPVLATACVLCGQQLARWWRQGKAVPAAAAGLTIAMMLAAVRYVPDASLRVAELPARRQGFRHRDAQYRDIAGFLRQLTDYLNTIQGPVLSQYNDVALYCPHSIMTDTFTFTSMADAGTFDDRALIDQIRRKQIAAIVLDGKPEKTYQGTEFVSRRWLQAMEGRYELVKRFKSAEVYRPIGRSQGEASQPTRWEGERTREPGVPGSEPLSQTARGYARPPATSNMVNQ